MSQATIETCDVFDGMEEAVLHIIADYLRGTRQVYAAHIDDDEVTSPQPKKHHRPSSVVLGQLTKLVKQITWPHELIYTQASLPAVYEDLSPMSFVNGYLEILATVKDDTKELMLSHLQELMADGEAYGWPVVLAYHAAWLRHLEQGLAAWTDLDTKLKLRQALVWHRWQQIQDRLQPQSRLTSSQSTPEIHSNLDPSVR